MAGSVCNARPEDSHRSAFQREMPSCIVVQCAMSWAPSSIQASASSSSVSVVEQFPLETRDVAIQPMHARGERLDAAEVLCHEPAPFRGRIGFGESGRHRIEHMFECQATIGLLGSSGLWEAVPPWPTNATSGSSSSELRGDDEFTEFASEDLPYYSDWRGSFEKLPWATDDEALRAAGADVAIVGAPLDDAVSSRPGRAVRPEGDPDGADRVGDRPPPGRSSWTSRRTRG